MSAAPYAWCGDTATVTELMWPSSNTSFSTSWIRACHLAPPVVTISKDRATNSHSFELSIHQKVHLSQILRSTTYTPMLSEYQFSISELILKDLLTLKTRRMPDKNSALPSQEKKLKINPCCLSNQKILNLNDPTLLNDTVHTACFLLLLLKHQQKWYSNHYDSVCSFSLGFVRLNPITWSVFFNESYRRTLMRIIYD